MVRNLNHGIENLTIIPDFNLCSQRDVLWILNYHNNNAVLQYGPNVGVHGIENLTTIPDFNLCSQRGGSLSMITTTPFPTMSLISESMDNVYYLIKKQYLPSSTSLNLCIPWAGSLIHNHRGSHSRVTNLNHGIKNLTIISDFNLFFQRGGSLSMITTTPFPTMDPVWQSMA